MTNPFSALGQTSASRRIALAAALTVGMAYGAAPADAAVQRRAPAQAATHTAQSQNNVQQVEIINVLPTNSSIETNKLLQRFLSVTEDGILGFNSITALQTYLHQKEIYTGAINGKYDYKTQIAFHKWLGISLPQPTKLLDPNTCPFGLPLAGPIGINSPFGGDRHHEGIDLAGAYGKIFCAAYDGLVVYAGEMSGYGNLVVIAHNGFQTYYAHASGILAQVGQRVKAGDHIGAVGNTGRVIGFPGTHLHYGVNKTQGFIGTLVPDKNFIDPNPYIQSSIAFANKEREKERQVELAYKARLNSAITITIVTTQFREFANSLSRASAAKINSAFLASSYSKMQVGAAWQKTFTGMVPNYKSAGAKFVAMSNQLAQNIAANKPAPKPAPPKADPLPTTTVSTLDNFRNASDTVGANALRQVRNVYQSFKSLPQPAQQTAEMTIGILLLTLLAAAYQFSRRRPSPKLVRVAANTATRRVPLPPQQDAPVRKAYIPAGYGPSGLLCVHEVPRSPYIMTPAPR